MARHGAADDMHPFYDLTGRVALVTGGGGDIGGASCMALGRAGADVIIVDLRQDASETRAEAVRGLDHRSLALVGDCSDDAVVRRLATQALDAFGHVDVLVNVAGRGEPRWFWELQRPDFDQVLA